MKSGVTVDADEALRHLEQAGDLISGQDSDIVRFAHKQHQRETEQAFQKKANPAGTTWPRRKHSYPWPLLENTGTLRNLITHGFGIKTRDKRLKLFGKIRDSVYLGGYSRGGGGAITGARKPGIVVAGAIYYGRKRGRSAAGYRTTTRRGVTRTRLHGGGSRLRSAASSGTTPPRPWFGFGQMAKFRIKRYARKRVKRVFG